MRFLAVFVALALTGCAQQPTANPQTPSPSPSVSSAVPAAFPTSGLVDYQLGGAYDPPTGVTIVARDSTDSPVLGVFSICYLNGFQTQPQDADWWLDEHPELLLRDDGEPVADPNWPDEYLLDTSSLGNRAAIAEVEQHWISECAAKGFDAVEFDNLDTYSRSNDAISIEDNLALATMLVNAAHEAGLLAGQKNSTELGDRGRGEIGFDFAVTEECQRYEECGDYTRIYGASVIDIEYTDDLRGSVDDVCADPALPSLTVIRDRNLVPLGKPGYHFEVCP